MADRPPRPDASPSASARAADPPQRKPYVAPRILSREPLEAMAAVCTGARAKAVLNVGSCTVVIKS